MGIIFGGTLVFVRACDMNEILILVFRQRIILKVKKLTQHLNFNIAACGLFLLVLRHACVCAGIFRSLQLFNNKRSIVVSFLATIYGQSLSVCMLNRK